MLRHENSCRNYNLDITPIEREQKSSRSLNIDDNTLETNFSKILIKLINSSNLTNEQQNEGAKIIKAFAAESALSKQRIRHENISSRKKNGIFFDTPSFKHQDRSNLPKVLQTIGSVKETEKFNAPCSTAKKNAVLNFEIFDSILEKMENTFW